MRRLDWRGNIDFIDASGDITDCPLDREALLARFHAREGEQLYDGAAAFAAMWRAIPILQPLGEIARCSLVLKGLEALYGQFLKVRPVLQRLVRKASR